MKKIALVIPSLKIGGVPRIVVNLAQESVKKGYEVDIVLLNKKGDFLSILPPEIKVYELFPDRKQLKFWIYNKINILLHPILILKKVQYIAIYLTGILICNKQLKYSGRYNTYGIELAKYIKRRKPDAVLSFLLKTNVISVLARKISGEKYRLIISERNVPSSLLNIYKESTKKILSGFIKTLYPEADGIIAVSRWVADELCELIGTQRTIYIIYNPVINPEVFDEKYCGEKINHIWIKSRQYPLILSAGRLAPEKDFVTLLRAVAIVCKDKEVRLIILGEGEERAKLEMAVDELGIVDKVDMPGYVMNPYPYMKNASVFVLSSKYEGFGNVLVEALACGCPVVSTDCPGGPAEILDNGRYGRLVPVGDEKALADAILKTLENPLPSELLKRRGREFSVNAATEKYLSVLFPEK